MRLEDCGLVCDMEGDKVLFVGSNGAGELFDDACDLGTVVGHDEIGAEALVVSLLLCEVLDVVGRFLDVTENVLFGYTETEWREFGKDAFYRETILPPENGVNKICNDVLSRF